MAISQSVLDNAATAFMASVLPKAPLEVSMGQVVAVQAKASGIGLTTEKATELVNASAVVGEAQKSGSISPALVAAAEKMIATLMHANGEVGKQASEMKVPK